MKYVKRLESSDQIKKLFESDTEEDGDSPLEFLDQRQEMGQDLSMLSTEIEDNEREPKENIHEQLREYAREQIKQETREIAPSKARELSISPHINEQQDQTLYNK